MKAISLSGVWKLKAVNVEKNNYGIKNGKSFKMNIPGSVQDTLVEQTVVPDPYYADNELETMFIGKSDWSISRQFNLKKTDCRYFLKLEKVDTIATLTINGNKVRDFDNEHEIHFIDVTEFVKDGSNSICFDFTASEKVAIERNKKLKYPVPCSHYKYDSPNRNLVRKAQCNAAWDWGLCLQTIGIYEDVVLFECTDYVLKSFSAVPFLKDKVWTVAIEGFAEAFASCSYKASAEIAGFAAEKEIKLKKGLNRIKLEVSVPENKVSKWWPNGYGTQDLYKVVFKLGKDKLSREIGFRTIEIKNEKTMGGKELTVCVNGQNIFCKGANWIPLDARPLFHTAKNYDSIILSAKNANMNMLRVWGGGWYEKEEFYNACDKYGILLWHDLMFSCSTYPCDKWFLDSVQRELTDQIRRLKSRTCIALWCGNNECLGALTWYEETLADMDKYIKDYEKLFTNWIDQIIQKENPERMYWPSSPCAGPGDYSDNWHTDGNGDMHFWTVWHERKDFDAYHDIRPRFCSEFGYQSFPSLSEVKSFAPDDQLNLTSPIMEHHQRNDEGNSIIIEMFTRYFRMPSSFEKQLYLSQVQQALAIETAVSYWRSLTPYCMGTLYWQLNDVWPVSSWSSIEYSGKWKALHYAARKFYKTVAPVVYNKDGKITFKVVNDGVKIASVNASFSVVDFDGNVVKNVSKKVVVKSLSAEEVVSVSVDDFDVNKVFVLAQVDGSETMLFMTKPRFAEIKDSGIKINGVTKVENGFKVTISSKKPSFYVMLDAGSVKGTFDDNYMFLNGKKTVLFETDSKLTAEKFEKTLKVYDLFTSSQENA